jgi:hypothetical protein
MPRTTKPEPASKLIDARIAELADWRGTTLSRVRRLINQAEPDVVEEWKWRGVPVWSHHGIICTGETYKEVVKLTFAKGASLEDPAGLFNASLDGNVRRAIDLREGDTIDARAFKALVRAAAALNSSSGRKAAAKAGATSTAKARSKAKATSKAKAEDGRPATNKRTGSTGTGKPVLLAGGNPQIPKGYGDAPVQAYIRAMPGWKRDVGRRLDALVARAAPRARKAVKWNTPFYGIEGRGWFLGFHCFTKYVKVTFFNGASLRPPPPVDSKDEATRYLHIYEDDELDESQFVKWVKQAAARPGWVTSDIET